MSKGWREVQASVDRARKLALPWVSDKGYHVERGPKTTKIVAVFERRTPIGDVLARVESSTVVKMQLSAEQVKRGEGEAVAATVYTWVVGKRVAAVVETLADAFSSADAELEVADYEVIGRVVWQE